MKHIASPRAADRAMQRHSGLVVALLCCIAGIVAAEEPLKSGDFVYVKVQRHPELSTSLQVDGNGAVELPYVGKVNVGGMNEAAAGERVQDALKAILKSPSASISRHGGQAGPTAPARAQNMQTRVIQLHNSSAEDLSKTLENMSSEGGNIGFDRSSNALIVTDTATAIAEIETALQKLDKLHAQVAQVHIESKVAEVASGAVKELGVNWFAQGDHFNGGYTLTPRQDTAVNRARGFNDPFINQNIGTSGTGRNAGAGRRFVDEGNWDRRLQIPIMVAAPGEAYLGLLNKGIDLGMMIDALVADNQAEMLAAPYIRTVNNTPAKIKMIEEFPYTELGTAGLSAVQNVRFINIGITLDVTPHVRSDPDGQRYVQLDIEPEISTAEGVSNGVPVRAVRSSKSTANVRDGQTLVIGGILKNDVHKVKQKVPVLGDVPVLGHLFKHTERSKGNRELMIFVTPTVYDTPEKATWQRTLNIKEVATSADLLAGLEARAEARKN